MRKAVIIMLVTEDMNNVLLLKRQPTHKNNPNQWSFPGGKVEEGESDMSACIRELQEETLIDISKEQISFANTFDPDQTKNEFTISLFTGVVSKKMPVFLSREHSEYGWINRATIETWLLESSAKEISPITKIALTEFINNNNG